MASDYGGEHKDSKYQSISFVVAGWSYLWYWDDQRLRFRNKYLPDNRTLSFKKLNDSKRSRFLVPFLRVSNTIPGLLATFLVDKRIDTLFNGAAQIGKTAGSISRWRPRTLEKVSRVAAFGSLLVAGLSRPSQDLLWITDQDEIVADLERHCEVTSVFAHSMSVLLPFPLGHFRLATTKSDTSSRSIEDFAAIPDLAAGSLAAVATTMESEGGLARGRLLQPLGKSISRKAHVVFAWLAEDQHPLKRLTFVVKHVPPDRFKSHLLLTRLDGPIPEYNWVPEFVAQSVEG